MSAYDGYQYQFLTREEATAVDVVATWLCECLKRAAAKTAAQVRAYRERQADELNDVEGDE